MKPVGSRDDFKIGAYVNLVCDPDEKKAIAMARMLAGLVAHFTAMKNAPTEHLPQQLKPITKKASIRIRHEKSFQ